MSDDQNPRLQTFHNDDTDATYHAVDARGWYARDDPWPLARLWRWVKRHFTR